jgi:acyl dehydratase
MGGRPALELADKLIDEFIERTKALDGRVVHERSSWNREVTQDSIRHFAFGIGDDNPMWLDRGYAADAGHKRLPAPPAYLCSVLYPILHGAPMVAPLSSLIGGLEYQYFAPVLEGDRIDAVAIQKNTYEKKSSSGRRLIFVISEVTYTNQREETVGTATGTMIRATQVGEDLLYSPPLYRYRKEELDRIAAAIHAEKRRGGVPLTVDQVQPGKGIPGIVRGPLTIGDMVCWQAAIGPSYRAGALGYLDCIKAPHTAVTNPITGWPVKYSQQHEDVHLAAQRGMPGPFDNGVMRYAWVSPLITNWMGDLGSLRRLSVQVRRPHIYGDTIWYSGTIVEKVAGKDGTQIKIAIKGVNQLGNLTTTGEAEVLVP